MVNVSDGPLRRARPRRHLPTLWSWRTSAKGCAKRYARGVTTLHIGHGEHICFAQCKLRAAISSDREGGWLQSRSLS